MSTIKLDLSRSVPKQLDQGKKVVTMSKVVMTGTQPLIDLLDTANIGLTDLQAAVLEARQGSVQASAALRAGAKSQVLAYGNLANHVQTVSEGDTSFILSTGYGVRASRVPYPPLEPPIDVRTRINGTPGQVTVSWKTVFGARNYEVQYTTDLSGATGWTSAPQMSGAGRLNVEGLTSGAKYAFRVRACANAMPGPWSGPVQQLAP